MADSAAPANFYKPVDSTSAADCYHCQVRLRVGPPVRCSLCDDDPPAIKPLTTTEQLRLLEELQCNLRATYNNVEQLQLQALYHSAQALESADQVDARIIISLVLKKVSGSCLGC